MGRASPEPPTGDTTGDTAALAAEMVEFLTVEPEGDGWAGEMPTWFEGYVFGGFVVAQAVVAAARTVADERRMHSLHGYFLRPVAAGEPVSYRVDSVRDGRTLCSRHLVCSQRGKPAFTMLCSFAADTAGYEYERRLPDDVPGAEALTPEAGPGPWIAAYLGPTEPRPDGTMASTHRAWIRVGSALPDDPHLHAALVAFATDWTGTGGRPLHLEGDIEGMISLDHAVWFHRPVRADQWMHFDVHSLVNAGGRGLLRGTLYGPDRRVVASTAQEMTLQPVG